ncbi:MAG: hypothetical protein AB8G05_18785 [Oligoflexales bacterium]
MINVENQTESVDDVIFVVKDSNGSFPDVTTVLEIRLEGTNLYNFEYDYVFTPIAEGSKCSEGGDDFELVASGGNSNIFFFNSKRTSRLPLFDLSIDVTVENKKKTFKYEYRHDGTKMADNCD